MSTARTRYLLAMGLIPAGLHAACNKDAPPSTASSASSPVTSSLPVEAAPAPSVSVAPTPSAEPILREDAGGGAWRVYGSMVPAPSRSTPLCVGGRYCVPAPATVKRPAPAPFAACSGTPPSIEDVLPGVFDLELTKAERATTANACCYTWYNECPVGRALRGGDDRVLVASSTVRADWSVSVRPAPLARSARAHLTEHWLGQASSEHASVASFNRFALQLMALAAPRDLVRGALDAAIDEVRHAEACYGLASTYAGEALGPGPLPIPPGPIPTSAAVVALETLRDGCLGESVAAELAREASTMAEDPAVASLLAAIAADEERHAELAWRSMAWLLAEHGRVVEETIASFARGLASEAAAQGSVVASTRPGAREELLRHGLLGEEREHLIRSEVVRDVVLPCLFALVEERRAA